LSSFLAGYGAATQNSGVVATPEGRLAFVAFGTCHSAMIDLLSDSTGAWVRVARLGSGDVTSDQYLESLAPKLLVLPSSPPI
jgi:hypothetical protein